MSITEEESEESSVESLDDIQQSLDKNFDQIELKKEFHLKKEKRNSSPLSWGNQSMLEN